MSTYKVRLKLDELLKERGIGDREFGRLTGIRRTSVGDMRANKTLRLPLDNLAIMCEVLGVEIMDILELDKGEAQ
ncbi:helix-turn-helix transcriptional regulator [Paenibacillus sp. FSL R5-0519]|uniref:helix-turn-helix domain-containing protein n=1 Tax=Paenibacillus sp. FSL R5-0519 TaxID=2921648 RepID=UPI0030D98A2B